MDKNSLKELEDGLDKLGLGLDYQADGMKEALLEAKQSSLSTIENIDHTLALFKEYEDELLPLLPHKESYLSDDISNS